MNLWVIAIKSVRQRALASVLTSLSVALGVMLMVVVLVATGWSSGCLSRRPPATT